MDNIRKGIENQGQLPTYGISRNKVQIRPFPY